MKKILKFIIATWELPQNLLGALVTKLFKATHVGSYKGASVYAWSIKGGMSLGKYIFVPQILAYLDEDDAWRMVKHEYGHTLQSKYLGWFYLLVIGLPSLIWATCFGGYRKKTGASYYSFYTESWADKLGGVERVQADE